MKRIFTFMLALLVIMGMIPVGVRAAEKEPASEESFLFQLAVDGKDTVNVSTGDIITVSFTLKRTDAEEAYPMYAMQDEISYDSQFFELVEGSELVTNGIETRDLAMRDDMRKFYMNYVSMSGGETWQPDTLVGSFQLKVKGTEGSSVLSNQECLVSYQGGSGSYPAETQDVTVVVSTDCRIHFETNGGSTVDDVTAVLGEKLQKPEDPIREGYVLEAWCTDMDLKEAWNFEEDLVKGNMTLYAKWTEEDQAEVRDTSSGNAAVIILLMVLAVAAVGIWKKKTGR